MYHHVYHRHCEKLIKKLTKNAFLWKKYKNKRSFIEIFKIAVFEIAVKLGPDIIFGSYLAQVMFFYIKFIFFIESEIYFKFYVLIYTVRI